MFKEERSYPLFHWDMLGDIEEGRPNLGPEMNVAVYRLMQFTLRDILIGRYDVETADDILRRAGHLAGMHFCRQILRKDLEPSPFLKDVQEKLQAMKIGIVRVEKSDFETLRFTLTVAEDLDCSGLPNTHEVICAYDEGFLAGILEEYAGKPFTVKEVDCWCSGSRVCRFAAAPAL